MGSLFNVISNKQINVDKQLLNASGSKLRQYFCSYRSICQNFSISIPEYMQIFGSNARSFDIWDPHHEGYINPMQMFSGLIVFSNVAYEDKIRFLYEIFDLNQQGFLQYDDLVFLFVSVCEATCKIYQLDPGIFNRQMIEDYLDEFFTDQTQLKYQEFVRWSYKIQQIIQYFQIIGHPFTPQTNIHSLDQYDETNLHSKRSPFVGTFKTKKQSQTKIKIDERFLNLIKNDHILLQQQQVQQKTQDLNPIMKWVYGIRIDDIRYPLHYRKTQYYKAVNEKFIYICGKNVVVLYPKLNIQKNYTKHRKPVSCVEITSCNKLAASGEMGLNPSIHLWEIKTAKYILKFDRIHKYSIKMLKFTKNNEQLITVGEKFNSPLVIINIMTKQKVLSTYLQQPILNIIHLSSQINFNPENNNTKKDPNIHKEVNLNIKPGKKEEKSEYDQFYIVVPSYIIKCSSKQSNNTGYLLTYQRVVTQDNSSHVINKKNNKLKLGALIRVGENQKVILLDEANNILLFDPTAKKFYTLACTQSLIAKYNSCYQSKQCFVEVEQKINTQEKNFNKVFIDQKQNIIDIFPSEDKKRLYLLYAKSFSIIELTQQFYPRQIQKQKEKDMKDNQKENKICKYKIKSINQNIRVPSEIFNLQLIQLIEVNEDTVIVVSLMGDVIKISNIKGYAGNNIQRRPNYNNNNRLDRVGQIDIDIGTYQKKQRGLIKRKSELSEKQNSAELDDDQSSQYQEQQQVVINTDSQNSQLILHKYCQIFKMEQIKGICFLTKQKQAFESHKQYLSEKPKLLIASNSLIYIVDQVQRQLISLQCLQQNITHIHSVGSTYVVATQLKYLMVMRDGITIQSTTCNENSSNNSSSVISGLKITSDNLLVAIDQIIEVYYKSGGNYLDKSPKKVKIDHGIPIHISTTSMPKVFMVVTREKNMLKLNLQSIQKNSIVTAKQLNCGYLQTFYPQLNNIKAPILFSGMKKIFLLAQPNGDIYFWNSLNHIIKSQQTNSILSGHSSAINQLIYISNGFISSGVDDGQIIIWGNSEVVQDNEQDSEEDISEFFNTQDKYKHTQKYEASCDSQRNRESKKAKYNKVRFIQQNNMSQINKINEKQGYINNQNVKLGSHLYLEQLTAFQKLGFDRVGLKDSQIEVVVRDAQFYKDINKNINDILNPNNQQLFQPLIENKNLLVIEHDKRNLLSTYNKKQFNSYLVFQPSFIYGFSCDRVRQSLFYVHHYQEKKQKLIYNTSCNIQSNIGSHHQYASMMNRNNKTPNINHESKQLHFIRQKLLPLNQIHSGCKRSFIYFTGRTAIVWSPVLRQQYYYNFHINRITCLAIHPNKMNACTAQISNSFAIIHIWNIDTLTLIHSYRTRHIKSASKLQFSRDGESILSLGGLAYQQSIQIYNWIRQEVVAYRFVEDTCFFDIKFNPYNDTQIALCGLKGLHIMQISNQTLIKKEQAKLQQLINQQITCMVYTSSIYGNSIQSDIITGSSAGNIGLFICGKYITCRKQAHDKSINCIKLCQLFKYKIAIITGAEDNMIKIWDVKFEQIASINMKDILHLQKNLIEPMKTWIAPQSIDIYHCCVNDNLGIGTNQIAGKNQIYQHRKQTKNQLCGQTNSETLLLVGTRNGSIIEIKITNQYQGLKMYVANNSQSQMNNINNQREESRQNQDKIGNENNACLQIFKQMFNTNIETKVPPICEDQNVLNQDVRQVNSSSCQMVQKVQVNYTTHFYNMPSSINRSTMFDIKTNFNRFSIMITYSRNSQYLTLWNLDKREVIRIYKLNNNNSYPSIIRFSKTNFIAVGYLDGKTQFYEMTSEFNLLHRRQYLFYQSNYQPVKISFSQNDSRIAVVYSKQYPSKRISNNINPILQENNPSDGQQVLIIYQKVLSSNHSNAFVSSQRNTHIVQNQKRKYKNIFWLQFNSGGNRLLICYTLYDYLKLNNSNRKRLMNLYQSNHYQPLHEYVLYDTSKRMQKQHFNQEFTILNFSPSVRAKYRYYKDCRPIQQGYILTKNQEYQQMLELDIVKKTSFVPDSSNKASSNVVSHGNKSIVDLSKVVEIPINTANSASNVAQILEQFVPVCQMTQYQNYTIMGTIFGEIFAVKSEQFYTINLEEPAQCRQQAIKVKCLAVYDSPINNMQVLDNKLFVTSKDCGSVCEFLMHIQQNSGLLFFNNQSKYGQKQKDSLNMNLGFNMSLNLNPNIKIQNNHHQITKYYETFSIQKIQNWLKYVFPKRKNYFQCKLNCLSRNPREMQQNKGREEVNQLIMEPYRMIGRNSFYKRNNILTDLKDNLITFSGCNLLLMSKMPLSNQYKQQFVKLDNSVFSVNPQISTIILSEDKRTLYAGTTEQNCQLIIWDISTKMQLNHLYFKDYVSILIVKVSAKQNYAAVLALSKEAKQVLFFVSLKQHQILASFCISEQAQICDIQFFPNNQFKFLTCGANYMAEWTLKGGLLNCQIYNMRTDSNLNSNHPARNNVIFYSVIFLKDLAITGGSDGNIYWWNDKKTIKKETANLKSAVLSLYTTKNSKIFASGGVDGKAIIWLIGSSSIPQKVYQFSIYSGKDQIVPSKYHIQSVNIGKDEIFIGTRSGEIYKFEIFLSQIASKQQQNLNSMNKNIMNSNNPNNILNKSKKNLILSAFDNDQIISCSFNISSQKLYVLTRSGIFSIFNLVTNEQIESSKIKLDNQQIVKMLVCKLSCKIYIVLKKSIDVYMYRQQSKNTNKFNKAQQCLKLVHSEIKSAILSLNQRYLAILTSPNHLENAKVQIYDMTQHDEGKQFYMLYKVQQNIRPNIEIIDYSTDNGYLVYKNMDDEQTIIDLITRQEIKTNMIEFDLEWNQQAKKTSKYIRDICSTYSDENKLRTILQVMNHSIIATDQMGSLRIFKYEQNLPETEINTQYEYSQIYLEHLNDVYLCIISADCSIVVTVGKYDRSIILWRIKNFDMLISKAINNINQTIDKQGPESKKRSSLRVLTDNSNNPGPLYNHTPFSHFI